ncbi:unnamed protein product [Rotaria sp. Silwood2]|nr:unnamed protein product [Rotaria sp. Silwood2]CAF4223119.1 unnamed protein product [Rotaria sp. Silwood2]CAF4259271.1 unnamed protein product [Rotaria sp. Silwood2]CAF4419262.1 unnamed protein product [Rotaria sp. Silwood2]
MVLPTVVQSSLKQQINRKNKQQQQQQQQQIIEETRPNQDDEENNTDHEINSSRKKYQEKICSPESAEDASQVGSLPSEMETEIYDCRDAMGSKKKRSRPNIDGGDDDDDEEEEGDFNSSVSDVLSGTGSAKNMTDFEDMSESEQQPTSARRMRINHQLSDIGSSTPIHQQNRKRQDNDTNLSNHTSSTASSTESTNDSSTTGNIDDDEINISNLSLPGQTLLWDLLQDQSTNNSSHLPENLLNEIERLFSQVLGSIEDKRILLHFIQACLDNLKKSTSSLISLQQLTKRLQPNTSLISIHNEITVRFQFLSFIFSITASPKEFNLTQNQADKLWDCLTTITGTTGANREELYNWLLSQLKNRDGGHALSLETFKYLLTEKVLTQKPEHQQQQTSSSTTNLTQQYNDFQIFELLILNYVSDVAMRALNQNVSTLAAQTLNSYQIQNEDGTLDREEPFIGRCINCLNECINTLDDLSSLRTINRISVLLPTHLELFMHNQTILINASTRNRTKDLYNIDERLLKNYIPHKMPMMLLLKYIEQFFSILAQLQNYIEISSEHAEARLAVSRLWEILLLIPTHSGILQNLAQLNEFNENDDNTEQWTNCLQRSDPFRLTYSLQIIDMLIRRMPAYKDIFVSKGGLKYLYNLFISKSFFTEPIDRSWCSGLPDTLLYTLKILCSCLLKIPMPTIQSSGQQQQQQPPPPPSSAPPPTIIPTATCRETTTPAIIAALSATDLTNIDNSSSTPIVHQQCHFSIYEPHWENMALTDKDILLDTLIDVQLSIVTKSTRLCCPVVLLQFANRTDLLHTSMTLFITLCPSYDDIRTKFIEHPKLSLWLKTLLLDAYDSLLKREAQSNIFRLCMVSSNNNNNSSGTADDLNLQPITDFPPPPPMPTQRSCPIDEEKAAQTLTISSTIESINETPVERICLVPILTNLLELIPYALKFTSSSSSLSQTNLETNSSYSLQTLNISSVLIPKYDNHSLFLNQSSHEYFHLLTSIIFFFFFFLFCNN